MGEDDMSMLKLQQETANCYVSRRQSNSNAPKTAELEAQFKQQDGCFLSIQQFCTRLEIMLTVTILACCDFICTQQIDGTSF